MERLTLAQAVGEAPISESIVWTPEEIDEWFAGDVEAAREHFDIDYSDALERERAEVARLKARLLEYEPVDNYSDGRD